MLSCECCREVRESETFASSARNVTEGGMADLPDVVRGPPIIVFITEVVDWFVSGQIDLY